MPFTRLVSDPESLTITVTAHFAASIEQVWQVWSDPRLLERWWGPPQFPATVTEHDLRPGARISYFMTGPDGEQYPGWWNVLEVAEPTLLRVEDGFADAEGNPAPDMPVTVMTVHIERVLESQTTVMTMTSAFETLEAMNNLLDMGMADGVQAAVCQIDPLLQPDIAGR